MKTTLDHLGRIALPQQVREGLGLTPGAILEIEERENRIVLTPVFDEDALVTKDGVLVFTGELEEDPALAIQRDREERFRTAAGLD